MSELEISRLERELDDYYYRLKDADKENALQRADLTESAIVEARLREALKITREYVEHYALMTEDKRAVSDLATIDAVLKETKGDGDE